MEKSREELAAKALGESILDNIDTTWWEYSEQGMKDKELFMQTLIDVINGDYEG